MANPCVGLATKLDQEESHITISGKSSVINGSKYMLTVTMYKNSYHNVSSLDWLLKKNITLLKCCS